MAINSNFMEIYNKIKSLLLDKKVEDIKEFNLSTNAGKLTDFCLIGSGTSSRHAQAVADYLYKFFKDIPNVIPQMSGNAKSGWIIIEALGIEVHIFKPDIRKHYDLESLLISQKIK